MQKRPHPTPIGHLLFWGLIILALAAGCAGPPRDLEGSAFYGLGETPAPAEGGAELHVTTLAADGPGSLRAALETPGPRRIVFDVGGCIQLRQPLYVHHPYVEIAGETAPSPGITLAGAGLSIRTHDVVVQHLRVRVGDDPRGPAPDDRDGIQVSGTRGAPAYNILIRHCSVSWAVDEGIGIWGEAVSDLTIQGCLIAENLSRSIHPEGEHSKGILVGDHAQRVAVVENLLAHNVERNPFLKGDVTAIVVSNVVYNPRELSIHLGDLEGSGPTRATIAGNVLVPGPDTRLTAWGVVQQPDGNAATRAALWGNRTLWGPLTLPWPYIDLQPFTRQRTPPLWAEGLAERTPRELLAWTLANAGARPWDRDAVDQRLVAEVAARGGAIRDAPPEGTCGE